MSPCPIALARPGGQVQTSVVQCVVTSSVARSDAFITWARCKSRLSANCGEVQLHTSVCSNLLEALLLDGQGSLHLKASCDHAGVHMD
jgi:hypothetical protein